MVEVMSAVNSLSFSMESNGSGKSKEKKRGEAIFTFILTMKIKIIEILIFLVRLHLLPRQKFVKEGLTKMKIDSKKMGKFILLSKLTTMTTRTTHGMEIQRSKCDLQFCLVWRESCNIHDILVMLVVESYPWNFSVEILV